MLYGMAYVTKILAPSIPTAGRKAWYDWNEGKWMGPQAVTPEGNAGGNQYAIQQETPHWETSHVPKAAAISKNASTNPLREQENGEEKEMDMKNSEKITAKLKEILRYQNRTYDIRSIWEGYVKMDDVLETQPKKELKAQRKDFAHAIMTDAKTFEEETWEAEKYIRLKWNGCQEELQKRYEGKRDRIPEKRKWGKGNEGKSRRSPHK